MSQLAVFSHSAGALMFLVLTGLIVLGWRERRAEAVLLLAASAISMLWLGVQAYQAAGGRLPWSSLQGLEILRDMAWFSFLLRLLGYRVEAWAQGEGRPPPAVLAVYLTSALLLGAVFAVPHLAPTKVGLAPGVVVILLGYLALAVVGMVLVEQLFRNTLPGRRWTIKFLCLGVGTMFAYDFYLYADALLFKRIDAALWAARGAINAMVVPLIAVSVRRNREEWSVRMFVSKTIVFHTATLVGAGVYMLSMAAAGYYIRDFGGQWGLALQAIFLFGAVILLALLMFSGQARARLKLFLNQHFFGYKYDYREEWLRFIGTLSASDQAAEVRVNVVRAIGEIVESPGGVLWLELSPGWFEPAAAFNAPEPSGLREPVAGSLARFLRDRDWVVEITEVAREPEVYAGLELPAWLSHIPDAWLIVPILHQERLLGFVVLARSRVNFSFNWEDTDLLKTVSRQTGSYLALLKATEALAQAQQFETFNRLSAYVVHDLKNLVAQLSLVVTNAKRHIGNPEFVQDAIHTVENAVAKMNRLLEQLRKDRNEGRVAQRVDLVEVLREVVAGHVGRPPAPNLEVEGDLLEVLTDRDRLAAVMGHLIQNAQEASAEDGEVTVRLKSEEGYADIEIRDRGSGMDAEFIRDRLFRPFDTTKGNAGMGVGVYESREFVRAQGGQMNVSSEPGRGTVFRVRLALAPAQGLSLAQGAGAS